MIIGFIGDVHGRVFHALAALATWQERAGRRFDALIQVGDLGAFPDPDRMDPATVRYLAADPSEADFCRMLRADGELAAAIRHLRGQLACPIYFLRGNHEDFDWLANQTVDASGTAGIDPFDLFRYVPDGATLTLGDTRIAFLGGAEEFGTSPAGIDAHAYESLMALRPGSVDVLVTHQGPYGLGTGYHGDVQGSKLIAGLVDRLQPAFHVAGHRHTLDGPARSGETTYLGLSSLVASALWQPEARGLRAGCIASLDTETARLQVAADDWLPTLDSPFNFDLWFRSATSMRR